MRKGLGWIVREGLVWTVREEEVNRLSKKSLPAKSAAIFKNARN
jgi:hypothetical protein